MPAIAPLVRYIANGTETIFIYPFPIFASEDLRVRINGVEQTTGFVISDAGQTTGGTVTFDVAPLANASVIFERRLPLERLTDFIEGGDFSARALNNELDFFMAALQQVESDQTQMLRYDKSESAATITLPTKAQRANKGLGFDGQGNPVPVILEGASAPLSYTASGTGAVERNLNAKLDEIVSVKDYGATGDGLTDDTQAFQQALAFHTQVFVPAGEYSISATLNLTGGQTLRGVGASSRLVASQNNMTLITLSGEANKVSDITFEDAETAFRVTGTQTRLLNLVARNFTGSALNVDGGASLTTVQNCAFETYALSPSACITLKALSTDTALHNLPCDSEGDVLEDLSGGSYISYNIANDKTLQTKNVVTDEVRYQKLYATAQTLVLNGNATIALTHGVTLLDASAGAATLTLPNADTLPNMVVTLMKSDASANIIQLTTQNGDGINGDIYELEDEHACVTIYSDGAVWRILSQTKANAGGTAANTLVNFTGSGIYAVDISVDVHILSASGNPLTARLPNAVDADIGRIITLKKIDASGYNITVTELNGNGPDQASFLLNSRYKAVSVVSDGAKWFITSNT